MCTCIVIAYNPEKVYGEYLWKKQEFIFGSLWSICVLCDWKSVGHEDVALCNTNGTKQLTVCTLMFPKEKLLLNLGG